MNWNLNYIMPIHIITAIICFVIIFLVYKMKDTPGRMSFILMLILAAEWALSLAFEAVAPTMHLKIFFSKCEYIGNMFVAVFYLQFTVAYTGKLSKVFSKYFYVFFIIPIITLLLAFTNEYHNILWTGFEWSPDGNNILIYYHGFWFAVATIYALILVIIGDINLALSFITYPAKYKRQVLYLIIGGIFPFLSTILYVLKLTPLKGLDISAMGIIFSGIFFYIGITREQFLDLVPVARHLLIEKMRDAVITLDTVERIVDINPAANDILQLDKNSTGKVLSEALPVLNSFVKNNINNGEKRQEVFINNPNPKWLDAMITPLMDKNEVYTGSLLVLRDITIRKTFEMQVHEVNLQLVESEQKLQELNNQKDKLFSVIAHDLLNPFHVMIGYSEILTSDIDNMTNDEIKDITNHIKDAAELGNEILVNLLEWSRSQSNSLKIDAKTLNLNTLIPSIIAQVDNLSKGKNIKIEFSSIPNAEVIADKHILTTVLRNLLTNAIKFSNKNSEIDLIAINNDTAFSIIVKDYGVGIAKEDIDKIFRVDLKHTTRGTNGELGTGLGLTLCKEFIEKHGGTLTLDSKEGVGSTFTINIPVEIP